MTAPQGGGGLDLIVAMRPRSFGLFLLVRMPSVHGPPVSVLGETAAGLNWDGHRLGLRGRWQNLGRRLSSTSKIRGKMERCAYGRDSTLLDSRDSRTEWSNLQCHNSK